MYGNQLDLSDRIAIEAELCTGKSFKEIAQKINRSTSTISREVLNNHEYIRYVIPKGSNFNDYSEEDILLLMNHINSIKRSSLKGKSPYECVYTDDYEMHKLMNILKMDIIPPDDVLMKPELFNINR